MVEMIRDRQNAEKVERHDLFSSLLAANDHDLDATTLTESELIGEIFRFIKVRIIFAESDCLSQGNVYIFLVAGHEVC